MGLFDRQIKFIDELEQTFMAELEKTIRSFDFVLKDFIVNKQLFQQGIDGDGDKLPGYKRTTIRYKLRKGQPVDRTTLHDEENFVASIHIDAKSDHFEVTSDVTYDKYIIKKYGRDVLKVTNENMREFMENYFLPNLKQKINVRFAK